MRKSTFTHDYEIFRLKLIELRKQAGLTQRQLADRLQREHSLVAKVEMAERRLDVIEFIAFCEALDCNPVEVLAEVYRQSKSKRKGPIR